MLELGAELIRGHVAGAGAGGLLGTVSENTQGKAAETRRERHWKHTREGSENTQGRAAENARKGSEKTREGRTTHKRRQWKCTREGSGNTHTRGNTQGKAAKAQGKAR